MLVSEINSNKVKIVLTDTEVLCCFGAYEKLFSMSDSTKALIKALLRDIAMEHPFTHCEKLTAKIHAGKNLGCVIILTATGSRKALTCYTAEFSDSESLIKASIYMHSMHRYHIHNCRLYRMKSSYRLLFTSRQPKDEFLGIKEFCQRLYYGDLHYEYTKEYGNPIITDKAVSKIAKAFIKDF